MQTRASAAQDARLVPCLQSLLCFGYSADENTPSPAPPPSPTKLYIPPGARRISTTATASDSDVSDAEGGSTGAGHRSSRVRFLALACLQLLIKSDPKAMHAAWPSLLPGPDANLNPEKRAQWDIIGVNQSIKGSLQQQLPTLAHPLVLDGSARVRHSAAATVGTLLEGPAQRAYLAVAELREEAPAVRGFVPLSASLGGAVVGTQAALLRVLRSEQDIAVLAGALRALGTALVGAPYARLPPALLPAAAAGARGALARAQQAQQDPAAAPHWAPILTGSLACLAAALGAKPPSSALASYLRGDGAGLPSDLLACASHPSPAVQLEALMALRGLAQQYHAAVAEFWSVALELAVAAVASGGGTGNGTGIEGEGAAPSPAEKVAQQSVLLVGDYLKQAGDGEEAAAAVDCCLRPAMAHTSPVLRSAGFGALSGILKTSMAALSLENRAELIAAAAAAARGDGASPVRAAASRALGALISALHMPEEMNLLRDSAGPAVATACGDEVAAVRAQAAAALATAADLLLKSPQMTDYCEIAADLLPAAAAAAADGDRVRPAGARALGALLAVCAWASGGDLSSRKAELDTFVACLGSENAKVQWSACGVAAALAVATDGRQVIAALEELAEQSGNAKTRSLALAALEEIAGGGGGSGGGDGGSEGLCVEKTFL